MTNDLSWLKASMQNVREQCQSQVERHTSLWEGNSTSPYRNYSDVLCIADCGGAGTCHEGLCMLAVFHLKKIKIYCYTATVNKICGKNS